MAEDDTPPAGGDTPSDKTFTQAEVDKLVGERLARQKAQFADYGELKTRVKELDEVVSSANKLREDNDGLKAERDSLASRSLRLEVALEKKLPRELAERLQGLDRESIEADADGLLKLVRPSGSFGGAASQAPPTPQSDMNAWIRSQAAHGS